MVRPLFRMLFPSLLSVALFGVQAGCGIKEPTPDPLDADGDHWTRQVDCDDNDAAIFPGAEERCDGYDNDCDNVVDEDVFDMPIWYPDADGDGYGNTSYPWEICDRPQGYVDNDLDCDDRRVDVAPGVDELCDDIDNNCDGEVDELGAFGEVKWYEDDDNDGYGNAAVRVDACNQPEGYVLDNTDCDDDASATYPGAAELCDDDDRDEDCDGFADDLDISASGQEIYYLDADLDSYGDPDASLAEFACDQPPGYSADGTDCLDSDRTVNPGATELCGDGLDNDCDSRVDGDDSGAREVDWFADVDGDGFGDPSVYLGRQCDEPTDSSTDNTDCDDTNAGANPDESEVWYDGVDADCDGRSDYDADLDGYDGDGAGDCDDTDATISPGELELCDDGLDNNCDGVADACAPESVLMGHSAGDLAGVSVAGAGDVNGDGYGDVLVGADREDSAGAAAGAVYLLHGPLSGDIDLDDADAAFFGELLGDHAGVAVAGAGDQDGDGKDDVVFAATGYAAGGTETGAGSIYLFTGAPSGELSASEAAGQWSGEISYDAAGTSLSGGQDIDMDGVADLLIGAPGEDSGGSAAGAAYLLYGPYTGAGRLWSANVKLVGEQAGDKAGQSVALAGDTDGDGEGDLLVGAPNEHLSGTYNGAAYLITSGPRGTFDLSDADAKHTGVNSGDQAGYAVAGGMDANNDGYADILVGAPEQDGGGSGSGAVYLLFGPMSASGDLGDADVVLSGENNDDQAGYAVSFVGDQNGNGTAELLIGARIDDDAASDAGAAYIFLDPTPGSWDLSAATGKTLGEAADDQAGSALAGAPDTDGDGVDDILIGAPYFDDSASKADTGVVWLILGGGWP